MTPIEWAEERLTNAHVAKAEAERALADAVAASEASATFLIEVEGELAGHVARGRHLVAAGAEDLKARLKSKAAPAITATASHADRVARIEAENRAASARQATEDLAGEAAAARSALAAALDEIRASAMAVGVGECEAHAARVVALEAEAVNHRAQLYAFVHAVRGPFVWSEVARRVLLENEAGPIGNLNSLQQKVAKSAVEPRRERFSRWLADPCAPIAEGDATL